MRKDRELKMPWKMRLAVIIIVVGEFETASKGLEKGREVLEIKGRIETIQTTALLKSTRVLRRVMNIWKKLAVTLTPVKEHLLTLIWKTRK